MIIHHVLDVCVSFEVPRSAIRGACRPEGISDALDKAHREGVVHRDLKPGNNAAFSPDGRWLAYHAQESGREVVSVCEFPGPGPTWTVAGEGGLWPAWSPDASRALLPTPSALKAVAVRTSPSVRFGAPRTVLDAQQLANFGDRYSVSPDGQRFLFIEYESFARTRSLVIVLNWTEELKRLAPTDD